MGALFQPKRVSLKMSMVPQLGISVTTCSLMKEDGEQLLQGAITNVEPAGITCGMGGGARTKDQVGQVMTAPSYDDSMSYLSQSTTLFLMESSMAAEHQASLGLKEPPHQHQGWSPCPKKSKDDLAKMEDDLRSKEDNLKVGRSSLRKGEDVPRKPLAGMISKKFLETPGQEPDSCLWDSQDGRKED